MSAQECVGTKHRAACAWTIHQTGAPATNLRAGYAERLSVHEMDWAHIALETDC